MIETYNLNLFKCNLCSEIIIAEHKSSTCPFCGAHDEHIVQAKDWEDKNNIDNISNNSKENLEKTIKIEIEKIKFYKCAMSYSSDKRNKSIFQGLAKIGLEHIFFISKILKKAKADVVIQDTCFQLDDENVKKALKYEEKAKEFYTKAYNQANEQRIKEIFFSFIEIETDYIELFKKQI